MTKKNNPICRSFRQDFPEFVERAEALGVNISLGEGRRNGRERVFWLDGYKQLTGYTTRSDGMPFTRWDAEKNAPPPQSCPSPTALPASWLNSGRWCPNTE
jgi:hypothetical protein